MRKSAIQIPLVGMMLAAGLISEARSQSLSHGLSQGQQPSAQQIEAFCANYGQLSNAEKKQYREQYERYCATEPVFGQPVKPQQQQQPSQQQPEQEQPQKPEKPDKRETLELEPAKPEPVIPATEPLRVDLIGGLELVGELARRPGERQRLRVTVENRGPGGGPHAPAVNRLWARVFLSDRLPAVQGGRGGSLPAVQRGRLVRIAGVPGPGQSREQTAKVVLPAGTAEGNHWWCVQVDSRQQIEETNEGNNVACAREVVALGGDSELSNLFGSRVADLGKRDEITDPELQGIPAVDAPPALPKGAQPLGDDDDTLSPPVVRDLEVLIVSPLVLHDVVPYPNALFGQPYQVDVKVRNNGSAPERFHPYFLFEGEDRARIGAFAGFGSMGGGEPGIEIGPGETKRSRMFIDFRREALPETYIEQLETGGSGGAPRSVDIPVTIFLGEVDAPGNTLDERVFKDADIENHVLDPFMVTVINPGSDSPISMLSPEKTGAELVQKHYSFEGIACGVERRGLAPTRYWSELEFPVGHFKVYTGSRPRCRSGGSESFVSLVQFDTEAMQPPPGWTVRTAVLSFETRDPGFDRRNRCDTTAADNIALRQAEWPAGKHQVDAHGIISSAGIKGLRDFSGVPGKVVYITDWVREWVSGDRDNHGLAFLGKGYADALSRGNDRCVTELGGFELQVTYEPE